MKAGRYAALQINGGDWRCMDVGGVKNTDLIRVCGLFVHADEQPAIVFGGGAGAGHKDRLAVLVARGNPVMLGVAGVQVVSHQAAHLDC